jgi:hypothetical protein
VIYSIGFTVSGMPLGCEGNKYMYIVGSAALILKELCGDYPSRWDCRKAWEMLPIFRNAYNQLNDNREKYDYFFSNSGWCDYDYISGILTELISRCEAHPFASIEVDR